MRLIINISKGLRQKEVILVKLTEKSIKRVQKTDSISWPNDKPEANQRCDGLIDTDKNEIEMMYRNIRTNFDIDKSRIEHRNLRRDKKRYIYRYIHRRISIKLDSG